MTFDMFRAGRLHVCERKCSTCIYRPGNLMRLADGRVEQMERDAIADESAIVCHKTLDGPNAVCRGFFDVNKNRVAALQIAERLDIIDYDNPDVKETP